MSGRASIEASLQVFGDHADKAVVRPTLFTKDEFNPAPWMALRIGPGGSQLVLMTDSPDLLERVAREAWAAADKLRRQIEADAAAAAVLARPQTEDSADVPVPV
jgi:hypothetical protein